MTALIPGLCMVDGTCLAIIWHPCELEYLLLSIPPRVGIIQITLSKCNGKHGVWPVTLGIKNPSLSGQLSVAYENGHCTVFNRCSAQHVSLE